jgi:hypothetical protein
MSQSKGKLIVAILAFVVLAMSNLACVSEVATGMAGPATPMPVSTPTQREIRIEGARSRGATLFEYKGTDVGMAICYGTERIVSLNSGEVKEICLTSQEANNLSLCQRNDAGNYDAHQDISGVEPGDWLVWEN